jgi:YesN/AraC family two-component response regulator
MKRSGEIKSQGLLMVFLSELIERSNRNIEYGISDKDIYVKKSLQYIEANYSRDISISDVASYIGLNRNYFCSVIKERLGISLQEYLIKFRVTKACELMKNRNLSIGDIARSVGYNDPLGFSKIFKKIKGCSPKKFRETIDNL